MASRSEQETTVTTGRDDPWVYIWTNDTVVAGRLEKNPRVIKDSSNSDDFGGNYRVAKKDFNIIGGFHRRSKPLSAERKAELAEQLKRAREAQ